MRGVPESGYWPRVLDSHLSLVHVPMGGPGLPACASWDSHCGMCF